MEIIETERLDRLRQQGERFALINVLPREKFEEEHIPGSQNVPVDHPEFAQQVKRMVRDPHSPIVVYCAGPECHAAEKSAVLLEEAGFENVLHYQGGMKAWRDANQDIATVLS